MKNLFVKLNEKLNNGEDVVLCTIISSSGSSPRKSGTKMLVFNDGSIFGTIGGGIVEYNTINLALESLKSKKSLVEEFSLDIKDVEKEGMVCGGKVKVFVRPFCYKNEDDVLIINKILLELNKKNDCLIMYDLTKNTINAISSEDKEFLKCVEKYKIKNKSLLADDDKFIDLYKEDGFVYIFGGGHISQALVPVISKLNFNVIVLEDRKEFSDLELFSGALSTSLVDFKNINLNISPKDYIIIMTRGHKADFDILEFSLNSEAKYIGLIGSKSKWAYTVDKLIEDGFCEEDYRRVNNPIGIDISAETPDEIAISIAAQLIKKRAEEILF